MTPLSPSDEPEPPEIDEQIVRELETFLLGPRPARSRRARLRALGKSAASATTGFVLAFVLAVLVMSRVPDATRVLVSVGPLKVLVGREVTALALSLTFSLKAAWRERRFPLGFLLVELVGLTLLLAFDRLL